MKRPLASLLLTATLLCVPAQADTFLDEEKYGQSLGGWTEKSDKAASYEISGSKYRTWKPTATPTPDGGTFISVRIDHIRGILASDDHASLELTISPAGEITTARSSLALQGKKITSDLIRNTGTVAGKATGLKGATKMGTDLLADLTSKLLREKVTEPGRVTFPAAVQHNYNLLCVALWDKQQQPAKAPETDPATEALDAQNAQTTATTENEKTSLTQSELKDTSTDPSPTRKAQPLQIGPKDKKAKVLKK